MKSVFWVIACFLLSINLTYGTDIGKTSWEARIKRLSADPTVVRLYSFDEGEGAIINNLAGDKSGALCMVGYSPYNTFRGFPKASAKPVKEYPWWNIGRWPWKKAVTCGNASPQFVRSQYHGLDTKAFSVEAWIRPHALEEGEWVNGHLIHIPHGFWGTGWSIYALRAAWRPKGEAGFRIGVENGTFDVKSNPENPFVFGQWNHLVAVYDEKEIRIYLNGRMTSKPISKKIIMNKPKLKMENDIKGLEIGGNLRFDIDELVIYNRILPQEEIIANFNKFKPDAVSTSILPPDKVDFIFPCGTGGYFPLKKKISCSIKVPPETPKHIAEFKVIRREDNETLQQKQLSVGKGNASAAFSFIPDRFGLFDIDMALYDINGMMVKKENFPIAVIPPTTILSGLIIPHAAEVQPWAKSLGVEWGRVVLSWNTVEPEKGLYNWELADRKINTALASGLKVLCCITDIPKWEKCDSQNNLLPTDLKKYQIFVKTVANRYRQNISAWEIWDGPFSPPRFYFRNEKKQYEKLAAAANSKLQECKSSKTVIDSGSWYAVCGIRQPAAEMGNYDPGNMSTLFYKDRLVTEDGQTGLNAWPFLLFPEDTSVAFLIKQILQNRTKIKNILLETTPDEFYPPWNNTDGIPSRQGAAIAALYSLMSKDSSVESLGKKEGISFFSIKSKDKIISVLVNDGNEIQVKVLATSPVKGIDCFGNNLKVPKGSSFRFKIVVYLIGEIDPGAVAIEK